MQRFAFNLSKYFNFSNNNSYFKLIVPKYILLIVSKHGKHDTKTFYVFKELLAIMQLCRNTLANIIYVNHDFANVLCVDSSI